MSFYLHDSYTLLLIFCVSYFTLLHFFDKNRIQLLLEYFVNQKYAVIYHRQDTIMFQVFTSINITIIFSILVSFYLSQFDTKISFISLLKIGALLFLFFITNTLITRSLASIFEIIDASVPTSSESNFLFERSFNFREFILDLINFSLNFFGNFIFKNAMYL